MLQRSQKRMIARFRGPHRFLSNFYPTRVLYEGVMYFSAENAYQAQKCADARDRVAFVRLAPDEAKRAWCGRAAELRPDWDEARLGAMEGVVRAKFSQNPHLARALATTVPDELLEGNTWGDTFWGVDGRTLTGENRLGRLLMIVRDELGGHGGEGGLPGCNDAYGTCRVGIAEGVWCVFDDIVWSECECVVRPTDRRLLAQADEDVIGLAGGGRMASECAALAPCPLGGARLGVGWGLRASRVMHVPVPNFGVEGGDGFLVSAYSSCLDLACEAGIHSIAFPVLGVGRSGWPKRRATAIALDAVLGWKEAHPGWPCDVVLTTLDRTCDDLLKTGLPRSRRL